MKKAALADGYSRVLMYSETLGIALSLCRALRS